MTDDELTATLARIQDDADRLEREVAGLGLGTTMDEFLSERGLSLRPEDAYVPPAKIGPVPSSLPEPTGIPISAAYGPSAAQLQALVDRALAEMDQARSTPNFSRRREKSAPSRAPGSIARGRASAVRALEESYDPSADRALGRIASFFGRGFEDGVRESSGYRVFVSFDGSAPAIEEGESRAAS